MGGLVDPISVGVVVAVGVGKLGTVGSVGVFCCVGKDGLGVGFDAVA